MPDLDHRNMRPPFLRIVEEKRPAGGYLNFWDLRIAPPNVAHVPSDVLHSLEHLLNVHLRGASEAVLLVAPMGCGTGMYIASTIADYATMARLLKGALSSILDADAVPLANEIQCGRASHHTLRGAQLAAAYLLDRTAEWPHATDSDHPKDA